MATKHEGYLPVPPPNDDYLSRGYGSAGGIDHHDIATTLGHPIESSPLGQSVQRNPTGLGRREDLDDDRGSTVQHLEGAGLHRTASGASMLGHGGTGGMGKSNTLKKKSSVGGGLSRKSSLKRSNSRRSIHAGSIKGVTVSDDVGEHEENSVFYTPVPTAGTPTELLVNRFQAWRKLLKDLITYFREVQSSYEQRSKTLMKVSAVINNTNAPTVFLMEGGINDANRILREHHKQAVAEANKARDIEQDVVTQLSGLRQDLGQKIKEIKSLSGDFKNTVEKEKTATRKAVGVLQEALVAADQDPHATVGRDDPYVIRMNVDRQVEKQIDEENYLHRAYLNLEGSGRELESIVVGEIQKAYNALAGIMKREADSAYDAIERLRSGPVTMPKDHEWSVFVDHDPHMVSPNVPLRNLEEIEYPGKSHPAAAEVRAGMLERKSKYLKSYTPGWYVLSPTHLHEFKSADRIYSQPPVMSLFLGDQKLGSHSQPASSSHKFMLKGRQTGSMHRGHTWVFRAESYDTMLAWYDDIKSLTETSTEERHAFVRRHARSVSTGSAVAGSVSGDSAMEEDEADQVPYSASESMNASREMDGAPSDAAAADKGGQQAPLQKRPNPGGRFPSDLQVPYPSLGGRQRAHSPSSWDSNNDDTGEKHDLSVMSGGLMGYEGPNAAMRNVYDENEYTQQPPLDARHADDMPPVANATDLSPATAQQHPKAQPQPDISIQRYDSYNVSGTWLVPGGADSAGAGSVTAAATYATEEGIWLRNGKGKGWLEQRRAAPKVAVDGAAGRDGADMELISPAMTASKDQPHGQKQRETEPPSTSDHTQPLTFPSSPRIDDRKPQASVPVSGPMTARAAEMATPAPSPHTTAAVADPSSHMEVEVNGRHTVYNTDPVSGRPNARATGSVFPAVLRHDADVSVSGLHIPGEFCE